jgi:hypothetical protein
MVVRIAQFGRRWMTIAVDDGGIFVDHPSRLLPRPRRIAFERFAAIEGKQDDAHTFIVLRDGLPAMLLMRSADQPRVVSLIQEEVRRLRPPRVVAVAAAERAGRVTSTRIRASASCATSISARNSTPTPTASAARSRRRADG